MLQGQKEIFMHGNTKEAHFPTHARAVPLSDTPPQSERRSATFLEDCWLLEAVATKI
jgi:hypothetical protein